MYPPGGFYNLIQQNYQSLPQQQGEFPFGWSEHVIQPDVSTSTPSRERRHCEQHSEH
jgi:hypothetical protein